MLFFGICHILPNQQYFRDEGRFFIIGKAPLRTGCNGFVDRIWHTGSSLENRGHVPNLVRSAPRSQWIFKISFVLNIVCLYLQIVVSAVFWQIVLQHKFNLVSPNFARLVDLNIYFIYPINQVCTTYSTRAACGPRKPFLRPARAFSVVENVAKARLWISNCRSRISSILQRNLRIKMNYSFAAHNE